MKKDLLKLKSYTEYCEMQTEISVMRGKLQRAVTTMNNHINNFLFRDIEKELGIKKGDVINISFFTLDGRNLTESGVYVGLFMSQGQVFIKLYEYHKDGSITYNDRLAYGLPSISRKVEVEVIGSVNLEKLNNTEKIWEK